MKREQSLRILIDATRKVGAVSVATLQATRVWHSLDPSVPDHVDIIGCMGAASSVGLGIALGMPSRQVIVVDGDGCMLMQLGTLVTIANAKAKNLLYVIMHNKLYETSGNQPIPGADVTDFVGLAKSAGFATARRLSSSVELSNDLPELLNTPGPTLLVLDIDREEPARGPKLSMKAQLTDLRNRSLAAR